MSWAQHENRYNDDKVYDACGLIGFMDTTGQRHSGQGIGDALCSMKERGNGLGAGYAAYGIYPEFSQEYAFHVMCRSEAGRQEADAYLRAHFTVVHDEPIPSRAVKGILDAPILWRFFLHPEAEQLAGRTEEEYIVHQVMTLNTESDGAFVVSSGKDTGVFKGVGHPDQIAEFYRIDEYDGYLWTSHTRFPTNTPGWWGGAHPFGLLDWSVVHNGEISSYGTNRRFMEMHGYKCTMRTDTEVIAYAADLIMRRHKLPAKMAAAVFASPLWNELGTMSSEEQLLVRTLRQTYGPLLLNGPFTIILARNGEMMGLADRIRLRPLAAGIKGDILYVSSELSSIYLLDPDVEQTWTPMGGEAVIGRLGQRPVMPAQYRRSVLKKTASARDDLKEVRYA